MTNFEENKFQIIDPENQKFNYLSYTIILNKGIVFWVYLCETLSKLNKNWKHMPEVSKNYLILKTFIFEVRIRRVVTKYIELIEKIFDAFIYNYKFFENTNDKNDELSFQKKIDFIKKSKDKRSLLNLFNYFKSLDAINNDLKDPKEFMSKLKRVNGLRNQVYHHKYFFNKKKSIQKKDDTNSKKSPTIMRSLESLLSSRYRNSLKNDIYKEIVKLSFSDGVEIKDLLVALCEKVFVLIKLDSKELQKKEQNLQYLKESTKNKYSGWEKIKLSEWNYFKSKNLHFAKKIIRHYNKELNS